MTPSLRLVLPGLALIGVSYGLARFAYGLFLPEMRDAVGLTSTIAGIIGSGSYAGYCAAIIISAFLVERLGPRQVALAAGIVATAGMALIAVSSSAWMLAFAVLFAGISTGLASPPMAEAVAEMIPREKQSRANTLINSGTSIGVALSGPIALAATGQWRAAYLLFATIAAGTTLWIALSMPKHRPASDQSIADTRRMTEQLGLVRVDAVLLILAAAGMGFASATYWTFAGEMIVVVGDLPQRIASLAWVVIGITGLLGGAAGDLIRRFGINTVHRGFLIALAAATLTLALFPAQTTLVLISAALFGAAYIMLTGVYLVWGVRVYEDRPAVGVGLPFLMIALGQVVGASVAGALIGATDHATTFSVFAGVAAAAMLAAYRCGRGGKSAANFPRRAFPGTQAEPC